MVKYTMGPSPGKATKPRGSQEFVSKTFEGTYTYLQEGPALLCHLQHSEPPEYRYRRNE